MSDETNHESAILDKALYLLRSQWTPDPTTLSGKREALLRKLREVGDKRLMAGIERCCQDHISEFWPPLPVLSTYIPDAPQRDEYKQNDREQARLGRLYREGSDTVLSAAEAQAFLKQYQTRLEAGKVEFEQFFEGFIADRAERRRRKVKA